tara:strand:+ start:98 stop:367 length:270 start_codon:yes stop_codon:yes gene_type:complete
MVVVVQKQFDHLLVQVHSVLKIDNLDHMLLEQHEELVRTFVFRFNSDNPDKLDNHEHIVSQIDLETHLELDNLEMLDKEGRQDLEDHLM